MRQQIRPRLRFVSPLALALAALCPGLLEAHASEPAWAAAVGSDSSDMGFAVDVDPAGDVVVAGRIAGSVALGTGRVDSAGGLDVFVGKFDAAGDVLWARSAGGPDSDSALAAASDPEGNVLVTGFFTDSARFDTRRLASAGHRDVFIAKYAPDGDLLWLRRAGGAGIDEGRAIAADGAGNVFVAGRFGGTAEFGDEVSLTGREGGSDVFLAKYDARGRLQWARQAGGEGHAWANGLAVDGAGNALVVGVFEGTAAFDGDKLTSRGDFDAFLAKYGPDGKLAWVQQLGGSGRDEAHDVALGGAGSPVLAGSFSGTIELKAGAPIESAGGEDVLLAMYQPDGALMWARRAGGQGADAARAVAVEPAGAIALAGTFDGSADFGTIRLSGSGERNVFVARYGRDGSPLWALSAHGNGSDEAAHGIAVGPGAYAYITGAFVDIADFAGLSLSSAGAEDLFLARVQMADPPTAAIPAQSDQ